MKKVSELFQAGASCPWETAMMYNGNAGFRIPEYQRQYDWAEKNIKRLFIDALSGFNRLSISHKADSYTFLGTLILVEESRKESDFSGNSIAVVDGQQRLTTLFLIACALHSELRRLQSDVEGLSADVRDWLRSEIQFRQEELECCAIGRQIVRGAEVVAFPRIIRSEDQRGRSVGTSEYKSPIAKFLDGFGRYVLTDENEFNAPLIGKDVNAQKLRDNFILINDIVKKLSDEDFYADEECDILEASAFNRVGFVQLLEKINDHFSLQEDKNRAISTIINDPESHRLFRALLFSAYFCRCIVLTQVVTADESAAFDIFDALNTTGEPLTALETLKPRVIQLEDSRRAFAGSPSEEAFKTIRKNVDEIYQSTDAKQRETKELLVTFALYLDGYKLGKELGDQRNYLRTRFDKAEQTGLKEARRFVSSIADVSEFRKFYWEGAGIDQLSKFHSPKHLPLVQLLSAFVSDLRTSLALPILARYWRPDLRENGEDVFVEVLKALTAFTVIRRAATGGTSGIDSEFRAIMAPQTGTSKGSKYNLCAGVDHSNELLSLNELRDAFRKFLKGKKLQITGKDRWVSIVADNPLAQQSRPLARLLHVAANHYAHPDETRVGMLTREGYHQDEARNFLNYDTWRSELYASVEHIAPDSEKKGDWSDDIYATARLKHTLGNLVLLPVKENSAIGNESWKKKRLFYLALSEAKATDREEKIQQAENAGIKFSKKTKEILSDGKRLAMLDPLRGVDVWDASMIEARSKNIAGLAWDVFWPWLETKPN